MVKKIGYVFFLAGVLVVILEFGLRLTGVYRTYTERLGQGYITFYDVVKPSWYWTYPPNDTFVLDHGEFQYDYITNSFGLRERETVWPDTTNIRLMVFGDSFTEGVGAEASEAYPKVLERKMLDQGLDVSVYNAGSSGGDPFYSHVLLRDKLLKYKPTNVIVSVNRTDFEDHIFRRGYERFRDDGTVAFRPSPPFHKLYKKFHVVRMYIQLIRGYDNTLIRHKDKEQYFETANKEIKEALDSTYALCRKNNVKFLVVGHVGPGEVCAEKLNDLTLFRLRKWDFDYPYIEIAEQFADRVGTNDCMAFGWPIDNHFNNIGYEALGELVLAEINDRYDDFLIPPSDISIERIGNDEIHPDGNE